MVRITEVGCATGDRLVFDLQQPPAGFIQPIVQSLLSVGPLIGFWGGLPVLAFQGCRTRGLVSGSTMAFNWAPTVLVSLPWSYGYCGHTPLPNIPPDP
jgi:hypothetical protein